MRIAGKSHQPRAFGAQPHGLAHNSAVVVRAGMGAAREKSAKGLLAQIAPRRELQERLIGGARKRDGVLAGMAALSCGPRRGGEETPG